MNMKVDPEKYVMHANGLLYPRSGTRKNVPLSTSGKLYKALLKTGSFDSPYILNPKTNRLVLKNAANIRKVAAAAEEIAMKRSREAHRVALGETLALLAPSKRRAHRSHEIQFYDYNVPARLKDPANWPALQRLSAVQFSQDVMNCGMESVKVNCKIEATYTKEVEGVEQRYKAYRLHSQLGHTAARYWQIIGGRNAGSVVREQLGNLFNDLGERNANSTSGAQLSSIDRIEMQVSFYNPQGRSYFELDDFIKNKKCCINVKNTDDECFRWACLSALYPAASHSDRVTAYAAHRDTFIVREFPVTVPTIPRIEEDNHVSINVFYYGHGTGKTPTQLYISDKGFERHINLLLVDNGTNQHFVCIKRFSALFASNNYATCPRCFRKFHSTAAGSATARLNAHSMETMGMCHATASQQLVLMPEPGSVLEFTNIHKELKTPFVIYADFESMLEHCDDEAQAQTTTLSRHIPMSYCFKLVSSYPWLTRPAEMYTGADAAEKFVLRMLDLSEEITAILKENTPMVMTQADVDAFATAKACQRCGVAAELVRDHDHITGQYRRALCNNCNIKYNPRTQFLPVFFHNLKGYDSHHIISTVATLDDPRITFDGIPQNSERFISFSIGKLRFLDSMAFMASSLEKLAANLSADKFTHLVSEFSGCSDEQLALIKMKGVFPYDDMTDLAKLQANSLPAPAAFFNKLTNESIAPEDYAHAQKVWEMFGMTTFQNYHDLYLKTDVLLLADVFEEFRKVCMNAYGLDPCQYYTAPGLSWDACLKMTGVKLELLHDQEMYEFLERGIRGGISVISHRYAAANNPAMGGAFDPAAPTSYISYLDANNLYGWAMAQPMPVSGFTWVSQPDLAEILANDGQAKDYIVEVDLEYPAELHDLHNDYPLAPESMATDSMMWSPYTRELAANNNHKMAEARKLIPNLRNKNNYVCHASNLRFYVAHGLRVTRVHRALAFKVKAWLKPYIDANTERRTAATTDFEKDFYKLMNNSVFGKTMENIRNRCSMKFCLGDVGDLDAAVAQRRNRRLRKYLCHPLYKGATQLGPGLVALEHASHELTLNKPIYTGFTILELSKLLMYGFHYDVMLPRYGPENLRLLFTDTDSLCYHIQTPDFYRDVQAMAQHFDLSSCSLPWLRSSANKKVIGRFKDETDCVAITEFVGLRSKMYSLTTVDNHQKKRGKGISRCVVEKQIKHMDYVNCVTGIRPIQTATMTRIASHHHVLTTQRISKIGLSCIDDKRFILADGVSTLAHGHYRTPN